MPTLALAQTVTVGAAATRADIDAALSDTPPPTPTPTARAFTGTRADARPGTRARHPHPHRPLRRPRHPRRRLRPRSRPSFSATWHRGGPARSGSGRGSRSRAARGTCRSACAIRWFADGKRIKKATKSVYRLRARDAGAKAVGQGQRLGSGSDAQDRDGEVPGKGQALRRPGEPLGNTAYGLTSPVLHCSPTPREVDVLTARAGIAVRSLGMRPEVGRGETVTR